MMCFKLRHNAKLNEYTDIFLANITSYNILLLFLWVCLVLYFTIFTYKCYNCMFVVSDHQQISSFSGSKKTLLIDPVVTNRN